MSSVGQHRAYHPPGDPPIVFFDGVCGLCNGTVNFLMKHDGVGWLRFATLQGDTAGRMLPVFYTEDLNSVVFYREGKFYRRSAAIARALCALGFPWAVLGWILRLIPGFLCDPVYRTIARYRYVWFGKHDVCRLPTPEERGRFLP